MRATAWRPAGGLPQALSIAVLAGCMASPESRQTLDGLTLIATTMEQLAVRVDSLPMLLDSQREAFLSAFDARGAEMEGLLAGTGTVLRDAAPLIESGERVAGLSRDAAASLNQTLVAAERMIAALRDTQAPGGAMSFEVAEYSALLADFRAAAESLDGALQKAEGLAASPREVIDHAARRGAQLMLLLFTLVAVYRVGVAALRRRSAHES